MAQEEFVILLGEEDSNAPAAEASVAAPSEEFVILLDEAPGEPTASASLPLPASATIAQVSAFYQVLAEHIEAGHEVVLDGAEVEQFDTSFAQLLMAASRKCAQLSRPYRIVEASPAMVTACERIAVATQLLQEGGDQHAA